MHSIRRSFALMSVIFTLLLMTSCSTTQSNVNRSPSASAWKNGIKGSWVLESIEKENFPAAYSVKNIFEEAPAECFLGSVWNLPMNGNGSITFRAEGTVCAPGAVRNIFWSVYKGEGEPQFQFKKIYPGDRPSNVTSGYRLDLAYADSEKLVMRMPLVLDGQTGTLVFTFKK